MCDPATITVVTIAVTASIANAYQKQKQIEAENEYKQLLHDKNLEVANRAALEEFGALHERELQERGRLEQSIRNITEQSRQARAATVLSAVESGTRGQSVDRLLSSFERQEAEYQETQLTNFEFLEGQLQAERQAVASRRQGRVLGTLPFLQLGPFDSNFGIFATALNAAAAGGQAAA